MSPAVSFFLLICLASISCSMAWLDGGKLPDRPLRPGKLVNRPTPDRWINRPATPTGSPRFRRDSPVEEMPPLEQDETKSYEVITDEKVTSAIEAMNLPAEGTFEVPELDTVGRRSKRAVIRTTVIRIRNKRTGKVTYVVIRRRLR